MTLKEIARLAGTSPAAVSRYTNKSGYVSEEKKERIRQVLAECDYQKRDRSTGGAYAGRTVLVIADTLSASDAYIEYIRGIHETLDKAGYDMYLFLSGRRPQLETDRLLRVQKIGFAGAMMISAIESDRLARTISQAAFPIVVLNRNLRGVNVDTVVLDNYKVGYFATQFLLSNGHRRIVHLAGLKDSTASQDRAAGFLDAMRDAGVDVPPDAVVFGDHSYEKGYEFGSCFARERQRPTAVFAASDMMALGFVDGIYENGLHCPEDVSIISTENTRNLVSGKVQMTTIGYNNRVIGRTAAELFLGRCQEPEGERKSVSFIPQIVERKSVRKIHAASAAEKEG